MIFEEKKMILKDGTEAVFRSPTVEDAEIMLDYLYAVSSDTDFLMRCKEDGRYPDIEQEKEFLRKETTGGNTMITCFINGIVAGNCNISFTDRFRSRHIGTIGIAVRKEYWGLGLGRALTEACIQCARTAGYEQLELEVVSSNSRAVSLYRDLGFTEFGRNPKGFNSRSEGYQELISMRLEL